MIDSCAIPLHQRLLSRAVAAYPIARGRTRLRRMAAPHLVAELTSGVWVRTSGVVQAEWSFLQGGIKEEPTLQCVRKLLADGMTFVDVGANIGYFALHAAAAIGPAGKVIAFEPTPAVAARLRENVRLNRFSNATVVEAAASDHEGHATFFQSADDPEANSFYTRNASGSPLRVATVTLDAELSRRKISSVNLIKIDAEGSELAVLRGACRVLTTDRPAILMEVNPLTLQAGGVHPDEVFNQLREFGYRWEEIERVQWEGVTVTNILATSDSLAQLARRVSKPAVAGTGADRRLQPQSRAGLLVHSTAPDVVRRD